MKYLYTCLLLVSCLSVQSQTIYQKGRVRELNSGEKGLSNVKIVFQDALPTISDANGQFILAFSQKEIGDPIIYNEITKRQYEIVNEKELLSMKISNTGYLEMDIIMAKVGTIDSLKLLYYDISERALTVSYRKELQKLKQLVQEQTLTIREYNVQLRAQKAYYESQLERLKETADKFARTNPDDMDSIYADALILFQNGQVNKAIYMLEEEEFLERLEVRFEKISSYVGTPIDTSKWEQKNKKIIQELIEILLFNGELYQLTYQRDKAEAVYDKLLSLDSSDLEIIIAVAEFYTEERMYTKAFHWLVKIIAHPNAEDWQRANAYGNLGKLAGRIQGVKKALKNYEQLSYIYDTLSNRYSRNSTYNANLAISYRKLGGIYITMGDLERALNLLEENIAIFLQLRESDTLNADYKNELATSYLLLGKVYQGLGKLNQALSFTEESVEISKELSYSDPFNLKFKCLFAESYLRLGRLYLIIGNLEKASSFIEEGLEIFKELSYSDPLNLNLKYLFAESCLELGSLYGMMEYSEKASTISEKSQQIFTQLLEIDSLNMEFKSRLAVSYLKIGEIYRALSDWNTAQVFFEESVLIFSELYMVDSLNITFKVQLALAYSKLGETYLGLNNLSLSLALFEKELSAFMQLLLVDPLNISFRKGLGFSYAKVGYFHLKTGSFYRALGCFKGYLDITKDLKEFNIGYQESFAFSDFKMQRLQEAKKLFKKFDYMLPYSPRISQALEHFKAFLTKLE